MNKTYSLPFPWQQHQWNYLLKRRQKNTLPHALLLYGMQGTGIKEFSLAFIKTLLCQQNQPQACNECQTCHLVETGTYPDFFTITPEEEGKSIKIDQIRELIQQLNQKAHSGNYKIVLLEPAEALPIGAANALLKTLEEPFPETIFILLATEPHLLPATIRSRCQTLYFQEPSFAAGLNWLKTNLPGTHDHAALLRFAENAPLKAMTLVETEDLAQLKQFYLQFESLCAQKLDPIKMAANWYQSPLKIILNWLISLTADFIRSKQNLPLKPGLSFANIELLQKIVSQVSIENLFAYLDQLYLSLQQLYRSNPNQQLLLENLFCIWHEYTKPTNNQFRTAS